MTAQVASSNSVLAGSLALNYDGNLVPVDQARITVGAGPRCTVRLREAKAQPLHCLITCDLEGCRVRRWSEGTRLNGAEFDESPLKAGDQLEVAGAVIEVESLQGAEVESSRVPVSDQPNRDAPSPRANFRKHYTDRCRALVAALRESQQRERQLQQNLAAQEIAKPVEDRIDPADESSIVEAIEPAIEDSEPVAVEIEATTCVEESIDSTIEAAALDSELEDDQPTQDAKDLNWLLGEGSNCEAPETKEAPEELSADETEEGESPAEGLPEEVNESAESPIMHTMMLPEDSIATASLPAPAMDLSQAENFDAPATSERDPSWNWDIESASGSEDAASLWGTEGAEAAARDFGEDSEATYSTDGPVEEEAVESASNWQSWAQDESAKQPVAANNQSDPPVKAEGKPEATKDEVEYQFDSPSQSDSVKDPIGPELTSLLEQGLFGSAPAESLTSGSPRDEIVDVVDDEQTDLSETSDVSEGAQSVETRIDSLFAPKSETSEESESSDNQTGSFIERYAHLLDDEDQAEPSLLTQDSEPEPTSEAVAAAPSAQDDDSIENYMEKMMERLRGQSEPPSSENVVESELTPATESAQADAAESSSVDLPHEQVLSPIRSLDELQRSQTPESADDLNAFRELANESARHAIGAAKVRRARDIAATSLAICSISFGVGFFMMISSSNILAIEIVTGGLLMLVSAWWGSRQANAFLTATREVKHRAQRAKDA